MACRQCRRVVKPISDHQHLMPRLHELFDISDLGIRANAALEGLDAEFPRHIFGDSGPVAGNHVNGKLAALQRTDDFGRIVTDRIPEPK
mgnify:CR=1 FL=1